MANIFSDQENGTYVEITGDSFRGRVGINMTDVDDDFVFGYLDHNTAREFGKALIRMADAVK